MDNNAEDELDRLDPWVVAAQLEEAGIEAAIYSSYSHSDIRAKFRILILLSRRASVEERRVAMEYIIDLLGREQLQLGNLAPCTQKLSQPLCVPSCPHHMTSQAFSEYVPGTPLDVDHILATYIPPAVESKGLTSTAQRITDIAPDSLLKREAHRRDRLRQIVAAEWHSGADKERIIQRVIDYDIAVHHAGNGVHSGPHFYDYAKHPRYKPRYGQSAEAALYHNVSTFVNTRIRSLERAFGSLSCAHEQIPNLPRKGPLPHGIETAARLERVTIKKTARGGTTATGEWALLHPQLTKRKIWHTWMISGVHERAEAISWRMIESVADAAGKSHPARAEDLQTLVGTVAWVKISRKAGTGGYPDRNEIAWVRRYEPEDAAA